VLRSNAITMKVIRGPDTLSPHLFAIRDANCLPDGSTTQFTWFDYRIYLVLKLAPQFYWRALKRRTLSRLFLRYDGWVCGLAITRRSTVCVW
jgi:hypothetical protein